MAERGEKRPSFPFEIARDANGSLILDFTPAVRELTDALLAGDDRAALARSFHVTIAHGAAELCAAIRQDSGLKRVVLSGGVFQNRLLAEELHDLLSARNFQVVTHRLVPPNDGGLALGQALIAGRSSLCA
jgi:hydrogenase maturation protein HypF